MAKHTIKLDYFKPDTGKWYASGGADVDIDAVHDAWTLVREWNTLGGLPGLSEGSNGWLIHVQVPTHPHDHPRMILP